jgi:hypothetical protein
LAYGEKLKTYVCQVVNTGIVLYTLNHHWVVLATTEYYLTSCYQAVTHFIFLVRYCLIPCYSIGTCIVSKSGVFPNAWKPPPGRHPLRACPISASSALSFRLFAPIRICNLFRCLSRLFSLLHLSLSFLFTAMLTVSLRLARPRC